MTLLLIVIAAVVAVAVYARSLWVHPWAPCRPCKGSGRTRDSLFRAATGTCSRCGGKGRKPRAGIRVLQPSRAKRLAGPKPDHKKADQRKAAR